jgi:glycine/betaine/sarcosine/D-proline reductase family selenoprotein B
MGIATAQICSMRQVATMVGSPRIVTGKSVLHPTGDPALDLAGECDLRRRILRDALKALESDGTQDAA